MPYIKHLSVALIALGLSAPVLANNNLTIPSQHGGFKVGVDTLYLSKNAINNANDSSYDWGIYSKIGYIFPGTGNDLTVAYTYLRADDKESMNVDTVDLEGGQRLTTGAFDMRLFAGLRYTHLLYSFENAGSEGYVQSESNKFYGLGPRFGTDVRYQVGNGFGLDTHLNTALLVGTINSKSQNQHSGISRSSTSVVPQVGAKLGIDYTYAMQGDSKSALSFEVGYQTNHSFNAIDNTIINGSNDVSFHGPYIDVKYYS